MRSCGNNDVDKDDVISLEIVRTVIMLVKMGVMLMMMMMILIKRM
jgi:hypothetical protein